MREVKIIEERTLINARELKAILLGKNNFSVWIRENIRKYEFKEKEDYFLKEEKIRSAPKIKIIKKEYYLTESASKKIIYFQKRSETAEKIKQRLEEGESLQKIINEFTNAIEEKITVIKLESEEYPEQLRQIKKPPKQLYIKGDLQNLKQLGIAIIGSRNCSNYGRQVCKFFTEELVKYNLNIISGLANGIDCCAHKTCIEVKGKTIAVLPSGFNNIYPKENERILNIILKNGGTVVTEYPPEFEKTQESCRERNRIMSGLAIGTLVVEAGRRSGTSITVKYTKEQNRKAFCIPSSLLNSKGVGTNEMIKNNKAKIVTEPEDIIKEFPELKLERKLDFNFKVVKKKSKEKIKIEDENKEIYELLKKEPKHINDIAKILNKPVNEITYKITLLELQGAIEELPGKLFKIKKG